MMTQRPSARWPWIAALLLLLASAPGCAGAPERAPESSEQVASALNAASDAAEEASRRRRPRLVVVVVFDQLRADYMARFGERFLPPRGESGEPGGFRYLMETGAFYPLAAHQTLQGMTCPGHANISTGSWPARHGIALNSWVDPDTGAKTYCTFDPASPLVGPAEVKAGEGASPRALRGPTLGDEFKGSGRGSRVASVGIKDRGAIVLGGFGADAVLWFDDESGGWVTSRFYAPDGSLPPWIAPVNARLAQERGQELTVSVSPEGGPPWKVKSGSEEALASPWGNAITVEAVEAAIDGLQLGQPRASTGPEGAQAPGEVTDVLMVSFSSLDKVGHSVGPDDPRLSDQMVDSDRALARLLRTLEAKVPGGLSEVVVAVTGDHGVSPLPEVLRAQRVEVEVIDEKEVATALDAGLKARFGEAKGGGWVVGMKYFHVVLNRASIKASKLDIAEVEREAARLLAATPGFIGALTATDIRERRLPGGLLERQVLNGWVPGRSGDVVGISKAHAIPKGAPANHITGMSYDRYVPLIIGGFGIRPGLYPEAAEIVDLAPTLAFIGGVLPPPLSEGRVLSECLDRDQLRPRF